MNLICLDMGILLSKNHPDFDIFKSYDNNYGYSYTDLIAYEKTEKEKVIKLAKEYVKTGKDKSYAIITNQNSLKNIDDPKIVDEFIYDIKNIVYSITKIDGKIFENFINKKTLYHKKIESFLLIQIIFKISTTSLLFLTW